MRIPPFVPPLKRGENVSKFDRHYGTRRAKRWRDAFFVLFGLGLLVAAVLVLDPMFSHAQMKLWPLLVMGFLDTIFLALALSFHLRYKSRE
jgi:hypothetical protein